MKKLFIVFLGAMLLMVGCSSKKDEGGASDTPDTASTAMVYESVKGEIKYNSDATIYADYYQGQLLYLEANVVGLDMSWPADSWTSVAEERGVANILGGEMEQVAALQPELIITMNEEYYEQYAAIAPTIYIPYGSFNQEDMVVEIGKILDKEKEATTWVEEFNAGIEEIKTLLDHEEYTYGLADSWGDGVYMYGANYGRGGYILYTKLGLKGTESAEAEYLRKAESYLTIDAESLINYAGDVLFVLDNDSAVPSSTEIFESMPTWNSLTAVKNGLVYFLDDDMFMYDDPYSLNDQIEYFKEIFSNEEI
ncbi:MAG: ABC transporter substrate-binding protein [Anaerorhabdus sp.]